MVPRNSTCSIPNWIEYLLTRQWEWSLCITFLFFNHSWPMNIPRCPIFWTLGHSRPAQMKEQFDLSAKLLIGCKTNRSAEACRLLVDAGFTEIYNVESQIFMRTRAPQVWEWCSYHRGLVQVISMTSFLLVCYSCFWFELLFSGVPGGTSFFVCVQSFMRVMHA